MSENPLVESCVECGKSDKANFREPTRSEMIEGQLCFNCLFWARLVRERESCNQETMVTEDYSHRIAKPSKPATYTGFLGHGGARVRVLFDDGRVIDTNDLWYQGVVPSHFRDRLPPNAQVIWDV